MHKYYSGFSLEETRDVGTTFRVICQANYSMESELTKGKEYVVTLTPRILPGSPLCQFIGDSSRVCEAHLELFYKLEALPSGVGE